MSKMTKPTVDVVRFTESDVIVASPVKPVGPAMYINGFFSSGAQDGSMKYGGNTYGFGDQYDGDQYDLINILVADGYDADVLTDPGRQEYTVNDMFLRNNDPATFEEVMTTTGNYYYNRSTSRWEYYQ